MEKDEALKAFRRAHRKFRSEVSKVLEEKEMVASALAAHEHSGFAFASRLSDGPVPEYDSAPDLDDLSDLPY